MENDKGNIKKRRQKNKEKGNVKQFGVSHQPSPLPTSYPSLVAPFNSILICLSKEKCKR